MTRSDPQSPSPFYLSEIVDRTRPATRGAATNTIADLAPRGDRPRRRHGLPPIGLWWPRLEHPLQWELLENLDAPLRPAVVRRIFDLCDLEDRPLPLGLVRLDVDERAFIAGWAHTLSWD